MCRITIDLAKRSPIKLLRPWAYDDGELFARMQRENDLRTCLEAITAPDFRFGVLVGESGCGKSSFLQAGIWPRLEEQKTIHPCLYVKVTEEDPVETLRRVIEERLKLPQDSLHSSEFVTLLDNAVQAKGPNVVVLFDQFEQFFVHRKSSGERAPFVGALAHWYTQKPRLAVKILVCFRSDLFHLSLELQKAMGYALGPQESFELKKLSPEQATEVFRVMANLEGVEFDATFIQKMARDELASREDGLVSPIDLQILAGMMAGQTGGEKVAFDRAGYQRLGGVEGLLERFLERALRARETDSRRQAAVKVMLALTDLERNTRAGVLSVENVKNKLGSTLTDMDVADAVVWLARNGLITPQTRSGQQGYELAHERLIPAICRHAGKNLKEADKANQLLDRRVHEWLGNERASRYLLTWRELRRIKRQTPFLAWGTNERQKRELVKESHRHWLLHAGALAGIVLLVGGVVGLWLSPVGQIWQLKRDLSALSEKISDPGVLIAIFADYQSSGDRSQANVLLEKALRSAEASTDAWPKISVLVIAATRLGDLKLLEEARQSAEAITDLWVKASSLASVAAAAAELGDLKQAAELLEKVRQSTEMMTHPWHSAGALNAMTIIASELEDSKQAAELLEKVRQSAEAIAHPRYKADALSAVAQAATQRGDSKRAAGLLEKVRQSAEKITDQWDKSDALSAVVQAATKLGDSKETAELLERVRQSAEAIKRPGPKAKFLVEVAQAATNLGESKQATELLEKIRQSAEAITDPDSKAQALAWVAVSAARLGDSKQVPDLLKKARQSAEAITDTDGKGRALFALASAAAKLGDSQQTAELLEKVRQYAEAITPPESKAEALAAVAEVVASLGDSKQAAELLEKARQAAEAITDATRKDDVLRTIALALMRNGNLLAARRAASLISANHSRAVAWSEILRGWHAREHPDVAEEVTSRETK